MALYNLDMSTTRNKSSVRISDDWVPRNLDSSDKNITKNQN